MIENDEAAKAATPTFGQALMQWVRIGVLSFGGPSAQIALMHKTIVDEQGWMSEKRFLNALSFCMLLPGPEAMQLATYCGWRLHGIRGGLAAGLTFVLPGAAVIMALATIYVTYGNVPFVEALFTGVKATVVIIVIEALLRISRKALKGPEHWGLALVAFIGIFFLNVPYPFIIIVAAIYGYLRLQTTHNEPGIVLTTSAGQSVFTASVWLLIWLLPLVLLSVLSGDNILAQIGWFFSKLAVVTFGGAYAVLAYMAQDVVNQHQWLEAGQMMDGLGLAETTPGPLILVTQFVGYLAAYFNAGNGSLMAGLAGAGVALWATFVPCFAWIFTGAPYIEWITQQPKLNGALSAITAVVVGVVLNLAIWFGLHVFFADIAHTQYGPLTLWIPDTTSLDFKVVAIAVLSGYLLLFRHWAMISVIALAALLSLGIQWGLGWGIQ